MRTKIEQLLLKIARTLRKYTSSKVVEVVWITLLRRENLRTYPQTLTYWNKVKAQAEIECSRPQWTAPEMDELSKIRSRKMIDLLVEEMMQERELQALKQKSLETGTHLEKTQLIA